MRKNPNGRHISLDFEPQFKALKDFFYKGKSLFNFLGHIHSVRALLAVISLGTQKCQKNTILGTPKISLLVDFFFNFNHFWNQWPKLIPKLALNLDFDHF